MGMSSSLATLACQGLVHCVIHITVNCLSGPF
jgi:hypothetical protein